MKKRSSSLMAVVFLVVVALVASACSKSTPAPEPTVTDTETMTATASAAPMPTASPAPAAQTIDGCVIEPKTDCRKASMSKADLRGYDMRGANLSDADVSDAYMQRINLKDSDLHRATLAGSNLRDAHLENADLTDADFSDTNVAYANFTGATATGANFDGAYRCGTIMSDGKVDNTSCEPSPTPSVTPVTNAPSIQYFDIPARSTCYDGAEWLIEAKYGTTDAKSVEITYQHEGDAPTSGKIGLEVPCKSGGGKDKTIAYTITATGKGGATASQTDYLNLRYGD